MPLRRIIAIFAAVTLFSAASAAAAFPEKPFRERLVNDFADAFGAARADSLEEVLVDFDNRTSNQISVVTLNSIGDAEIASYAVRLANMWGIGSERNNGVLILLIPRGENPYVEVTIQVGRGLEGAIPDVYASRIIRNIMGPLLREDRYVEAVGNACDELMMLASGEISEPRDGQSEEWTAGEIVAFIIFIALFIAFLLIVIEADRKHGGGSGTPPFISGGFGGPTIRGGNFGSFGGGNFGGGGFGGGGFGGFGGGSFGGGGATGRF